MDLHVQSASKYPVGEGTARTVAKEDCLCEQESPARTCVEVTTLSLYASLAGIGRVITRGTLELMSDNLAQAVSTLTVAFNLRHRMQACICIVSAVARREAASGGRRDL